MAGLLTYDINTNDKIILRKDAFSDYKIQWHECSPKSPIKGLSNTVVGAAPDSDRIPYYFAEVKSCLSKTTYLLYRSCLLYTSDAADE